MTTPPTDSGNHPVDDFDWDADVSSLDEQAAGWLVRLTSGHVTADERAEFVRWRDADPAHEAALSRLRAIWGAAAAALDAPAATLPPPATTIPTPRSRRRSWRGWSLAASVVVSLALGYQYQSDWRHAQTTAAGERRQIALDDGSTVLLGSDTAIDIAFSPTRRGIRLVRGEAYFEIRHDPARPFVIDAGNAEVEVVGTRFSVQRDDDAGDVTVVDGRVRVRLATTEVLLGADQHIGFDRKGLGAAESVSAEDALAWRSGRLVIRGETLSEVVAQINRQRPGTIVVRVDAARQQPINAVIALDRVDDWLAALEQQGAGRVVSLGPLTVIY
ncbi:MAG TPA: FecR domain-containing protein [Fontimonas sp.]